MEAHGPTTDSCYVSGAVHVNDMVQMLAGQGRQNMVAILDVAMPAPSLSGIYSSISFYLYFQKRTFYRWSQASAICNTGKHLGQSLLGSLQPLTPEVNDDAEDLLTLESMTVHGVFGSGMYYIKLSSLIRYSYNV